MSEPVTDFNDLSTLSDRHLLEAVDEFLEFGFVFNRRGQFTGRYRVPFTQLWCLNEYGVALYEEIAGRADNLPRATVRLLLADLDAVLDPLQNLLASADLVD